MSLDQLKKFKEDNPDIEKALIASYVLDQNQILQNKSIRYLSLTLPEEVLQSGIGITESGTTITVQDYFQNILNNQQDMPPDFQKVVNDNFWDLLYTDKK